MFFVILACATDITETTDTAAPDSSPALQGHVLEGPCIQGITQTVDLGTESPLQYAVEVRYASGLAEQMHPDLLLRPSLLPVDATWGEAYESPLYRDGKYLTFSCGYAWELQGPRIDGVAAGMAVAYRISWLTME